jgi:hypothetical protein
LIGEYGEGSCRTPRALSPRHGSSIQENKALRKGKRVKLGRASFWDVYADEAGITAVRIRRHDGVLIGVLRFTSAEWKLRSWAEWEEFFDMYIKKIVLTEGNKPGGPAAWDSDWEDERPALLEYLTATTDENGRPRQTATITLCAENGLWKAALNDREQLASLWVSGESVEAVLGLLEAAARLPDGPWRRSKWQAEEWAKKHKKRS